MVAVTIDEFLGVVFVGDSENLYHGKSEDFVFGGADDDGVTGSEFFEAVENGRTAGGGVVVAV